VTPISRSSCFALIPQRVLPIRKTAQNQSRKLVVDLWKIVPEVG
jgi:hypothetical protein